LAETQAGAALPGDPFEKFTLPRPPLTTLAEKVRPGRAALIVIDMQNDFCAEGGMMDHEGGDLSQVQAMAERLPSLIDAARAAGVFVVFVRNVYSTDNNWYLSEVWLEQAARRRGESYTRRPVCEAGEWNGDFYGDVRPLAGEPIVTKHRFDAFTNTDLDLVLRAHRIETIVLTGVATNVCVETTARAGFVRDYYIVLAGDGTATYSAEEHDAALRTIDKYFGEVTSLDELARLWRAATPA
jgi:ureidoacrylate peracid hydrolase